MYYLWYCLHPNLQELVHYCWYYEKVAFLEYILSSIIYHQNGKGDQIPLLRAVSISDVSNPHRNHIECRYPSFSKYYHKWDRYSSFSEEY